MCEHVIMVISRLMFSAQSVVICSFLLPYLLSSTALPFCRVDSLHVRLLHQERSEADQRLTSLCQIDSLNHGVACRLRSKVQLGVVGLSTSTDLDRPLMSDAKNDIIRNTNAVCASSKNEQCRVDAALKKIK